MRIINIYLYKRRASQLLRGGDLPTSGPKIFQMRARSLGGARESSSSVEAASLLNHLCCFVLGSHPERKNYHTPSGFFFVSGSVMFATIAHPAECLP